MSDRRHTLLVRLAALVGGLSLVGAMVVWPGFPRVEAADPQQVTFKLEGCDRDPQLTLPNSEGEFVCPDSDYGTGNTGRNWAELDLLPFRLTASAKPAETYTIAVTGESERGGVDGFDAITEPQLNVGLSDPTCGQPQVGPQREARPGLGGEDATMYRNVTITAAAGETCVYDYAMRLAIGSSRFPGSSLSARLAFEDLDGSPGQRNVPTPVQYLAAQQLGKSILAGRGDGYLWSLSKSTVASAVSSDTCQADPTGSFTSTIHWDRTPVTGAVTWTSTVRASNPSSRSIIVRVTDAVRANGVEVDRTLGDRFEVPAHSTHIPVLTHSGTAPAGTTTVSDTATATYIDSVTGVDIGQQTTATASTGVRVVAAGNSTAEISDVTTSSGPPISIDSMTSGTANSDTGEPVSRPIVWESGKVNGSGEATLTLTAHLDQGFEGRVGVDDVATLRHDQGEATATGSADVLGEAADPTITFVKTVDVPPAEDALFRFELWFASQDPATDPSIISGPVTIPAGESQSQSITIDVPPSDDGYIYEEDPAPGYVGGGDGEVDPLAKCDHLDGVVPNQRLMGTIRVLKVTEGDVLGADPTAAVVVNCAGDTYDQDLVVPAGPTGVETDPIPSGTPCAISEPDPPPGYELVSIQPSEVVVQPGSDPVEVTVTNARLTGALTVTKVIEGVVGSATRTFPVEVDCEPGGAAYDESVEITVPPGETSASATFEDIPSGLSCTVEESPVPAGWALVSIAPGSEVDIEPGPATEVTITNERVTGSLVVTKQAIGFLGGGAGTEFTVGVVCDDGFSVTVVLDITGDSADSAAFEGITTGAVCTVTEVDEPGDGWTLESILPDEDPATPGAQVTIGDDPSIPATVTVTNRREVADFTIDKQIEGPVAGAGLDFTVQVDCEGPTVDDEQRTITVGDDGTGDVQVGGVPVGAECTVTENDPTESWELVSISPSPVLVTSDDEDTVTVTNRRAVGEIRIVKRLDGPVAGADTVFTLDLDCDQDQFDEQIEIEVDDGESAAVTVSDIPTGVDCGITETGTPPGWTLDSIDPSHATVGDQPVELVATNRRERGGLEIVKHLLGPIDGAPTTFSAFLDCEGDAFDQEVVVDVRNGVAARTEITGIPVGVTCTATEVRVPAEWTLGGVAGGNSVTITDTELITDVVNTRVTGDVTVAKAVRGRPGDSAATFNLALDCDDDLFDTAVPVDVPVGETRVQEQFSGIPTGVECSVSEESLPSGWRLVSIMPARATIGESSPRQFTVTNRQRRPGEEPPTPSPSPSPGPTQEPPTQSPSPSPGRTQGPPTSPPLSNGELPDTGSSLSRWMLFLLLAAGGASIAAASGVIWYSRREDRN